MNKLLVFRWIFMWFNCALPVGTEEKSLVPSPAFHLIRQLCTWIRPSSVFSKMKSLISLCLFSWERCFSPLITFVSFVGLAPVSSCLVLGSPDCAQHLRCWVEKTEYFPGPAGNALPVASQEAANVLYHEGTWLSHGQVVVH